MRSRRELIKTPASIGWLGPTVSADEYLKSVLDRESVDSTPDSPFRGLVDDLADYGRRLAGGGLLDVQPVGGSERGTANASGRPIGFLYSFSPHLPDSIGKLYEGLFALFDRLGYEPERRDAGIVLLYRNVPIDIIPARREAMTGEVHELWIARSRRSVKTSPLAHAEHVRNSGRIDEIRCLKIWRDQIGLDFPSFHLELAVLAALRGRTAGTLAANVWTVFGYLETLFAARSLLDPFNANNIVSDHMDAAGKDAIRRAAGLARSGRPWSQIIT
jgi:hypothetical protein